MFGNRLYAKTKVVSQKFTWNRQISTGKSHYKLFFWRRFGLVICIAGKSLKSNHPFPYVGYLESFKARRGPKFPPQMSFSFWRVKKEGKPHPRTILDK